MAENLKLFATRLKNLRIEKGYTQEELAERVNNTVIIDATTLSAPGASAVLIVFGIIKKNLNRK